MTKMMLAATVAVSGISAATTANAALVFNINQVGSDVQIVGSGTINTSGFSSSIGTIGSGVIASTAFIGMGPSESRTLYFEAFSNSISFGNGGGIAANSTTGTIFGFYSAFNYLMTPLDYVSGSALSGTDTYDNRTLASMGMSLGSYVLNLRNGDTITVNVGPVAAVPETATWGMMIAGFGMMGAAMRTRRSTKVSFA
jgi:hypothetical protein